MRKLWPLHPLPSHAPIFSFSVSLAPTRCPILNGLRRTILSTPRWFLRLLASGPSLKPERRCASPVLEGGEGKFLKRRNIFTRLPIIRRIVCVLPTAKEHSCGRALKEFQAACSPGYDKNRVKSKAIPADNSLSCASTACSARRSYITVSFNTVRCIFLFREEECFR